MCLSIKGGVKDCTAISPYKAYLSNVQFKPCEVESSNFQALPVTLSAAQSSKGPRGGSLAPPTCTQQAKTPLHLLSRAKYVLITHHIFMSI